MNSTIFKEPGSQAVLRGVGKRVFWAYPTIVVQDTADLIALYMPAGVLGKDVVLKPTPREYLSPERINIVSTKWERTDVLYLIVPNDAFSIYLMRNTHNKDMTCWYINLQEPIRRTSMGYDTMDHMIDIVVSPNMVRWKWKDVEEFATAEKAGVFTKEKACAIRSEGERAVQLLMNDRRSMYETWIDWHPNPRWEIPRLPYHWDEIEIE